MDNEDLFDADRGEPECVEPVEFKAVIIQQTETITETETEEHHAPERNCETPRHSSQNGYLITPSSSFSTPATSSPSIVISTASSNRNSGEDGNVAGSSSSLLSSFPSDAGRYLINEATQFSTEIKRLRGELAVARKRIQEQDFELEKSRQDNGVQEEKLREAEEIMTDQQRKIERMEEENRNLESGNHVDLRELKGLVGRERTGRLEAQAKYEKMRDSFKKLSQEFKQLIELLQEEENDGERRRPSPPKKVGRRKDEEDEYEDIVPQENKLETLTTFVENKFATWTDTQLKMKTELFNTQKTVLTLTQMLNSHNVTHLSSPPTRGAIAAVIPARRAPSRGPQRRTTEPVIPQAAMQELKQYLSTHTVVRPPPRPPARPATPAPGNAHHGIDDNRTEQGFFCLCGQEYSSRSNLLIHVRTFTEEGKFKCDICKARFVLYYMLRRHEKEKHNVASKGTVGCAVCGKVFSSFISLYAHRKQAHSDLETGRKPASRKITAKRGIMKKRPKKMHPYCDDGDDDEEVAEIMDPEDLDEEEEDDDVEESDDVVFPGRLPPKSRDESPRTQYSVVGSADPTTHGIDPAHDFRCLCGIQYSRQINLTRHIASLKTPEKRFACSKCPKSFTNAGTLRSHFVRIHNKKRSYGNRKMGAAPRGRKGLMKETTEVEEENEGDAHSGPFAGFEHEHGMNIARRHQGFFCICGIQFVTRKSLDGHVLVQNKGQRQYTEVGDNEDDDDTEVDVTRTPPAQNKAHGVHPFKPDQCLCGLKLGKKKLMGHLAYHAERKAFICNLCPVRFVGIWYLKRHVEKMHPGVSVDNITSHTVRSECGQCLGVFENLDKFREHVRVAHPSEFLDGAELEDKSEKEGERSITSIRRTGNPIGGLITPARYPPKRSPSKGGNSQGGETETPKKFLCDHCDAAFAEVSQLSRHKGKMHNIRTPGFQIGCKQCGLAFPTRSLFVRHRMDVHKSWFGGSRPQSPKASHARTSPLPEAIPLDDDDEEEEESPATNFHSRRPQMPALSNETLPEGDSGDSSVSHKVDTTKAHLGHFCICGTHFLEKKNLYSHIRRKTNQWNFTCNMCGKFFYYNSTLRRHMWMTHKVDNAYSEKNKDVGCVTCGKTFKRWVELQRHRKIAHKYGNESPLNTPPETPSRSRTPTPHRNSTHQADAGEPPSLERPEGSIIPHGVDVSRAHRGYFCLCGKKCSSERSLSVHIGHSHRQQSWPCSYCDQILPTSTYLKQHVRRTHKIRAGLGAARSRPSKAKYCRKCGKHFRSNLELQRHTRMAHGPKSRNSAFLSRRRPHTRFDSGEVHYAVTSVNGPPRCACGREYQSRSGLQKHVRILTRGKVFQCPWCEKRYAERPSLKVHAGNQHNVTILPDDTYGCTLCDSNAPPFPTLELLTDHRVEAHQMPF